MILYSLKTLAPGRFMLAKFDEDFNVAATYTLEAKGFGYSCNCPAADRNKVKPCKHQRAMKTMLPKVDTDEFYCLDAGTWHQPLAEPGAEMPRDPALSIAGGEHRYVGSHEGVPIFEIEALDNGQGVEVEIEGDGDVEVEVELIAGEGPGPSPLAACHIPSPSQERPSVESDPGGRGQPAAKSWRRV